MKPADRDDLWPRPQWYSIVCPQCGRPAGYAQAVKEDLAMHLERWGDARVVDVREVEAKRK